MSTVHKSCLKEKKCCCCGEMQKLPVFQPKTMNPLGRHMRAVRWNMCHWNDLLKNWSPVLHAIHLKVFMSDVFRHSIWHSFWHLFSHSYGQLFWSSELRSCSAHWDLGVGCWEDERRRRKEGTKEEEVTLTKPRDPHLAGGENMIYWCFGGPLISNTFLILFVS